MFVDDVLERLGFGKANNAREIVGVQALRGIAAFMVVLDHYMIHFVEKGFLHPDYLGLAHAFGNIGVRIFFVISGFVMILTNNKRYGSAASAFDFLLRRLIRIWPLYFLATMIFVLGSMKHCDLCTGENLLKSLTFVPFVGEFGAYHPLLGKGWTLNYEMFFYVIFSIGLLMSNRVGFIFTTSVVSLIGVGGAFVDVGSGPVSFYFDGILLYFVAGMLIAYFRPGKDFFEARLPYASSNIIISIALLSFLILAVLELRNIDMTYLKIFVVGLVVLINSSECSIFSRKTLRLSCIAFGDSSYVLYLFHGFVFIGMSPIFYLRNETFILFSLFIVVAAVAVISAVLIHVFLERPLQRLVLRYYDNRRLR